LLKEWYVVEKEHLRLITTKKSIKLISEGRKYMAIIKTIIDEDRIYVPVKFRKNLDAKGKFFTLCKSMPHRTGYDYYFRLLVEKEKVKISENNLKRYKKHGWKNLVIIARVGISGYIKERWHFLVICSPLLYMEVNTASLIIDNVGAPLIEMKNALITYLDKAGKITIPKSYRKSVYIDYPAERKIKSVNILMIKKDFVLEIWHPYQWRTASRALKGLFNNLSTKIK
jgi:DNA-binding transcriptional regulator/RsmH inhibitor MraZ